MCAAAGPEGSAAVFVASGVRGLDWAVIRSPTPTGEPPAEPRGPGPRASRAAATEIVRTLRRSGHVAYFAGGCVRDEMLGLEPADHDVATDATPDRIAALFRNSNLVGAAFGVVLAKVAGVVVEVATFRSDGEYADKRRPQSVRFSSPIEDAARRDFTVNALFLDPLSELDAVAAEIGRGPALHAAPGGGVVIDFVGGVRDLAARVLRAVGDADARLAEDHLRALRAVRLASRLGFEIEAATAAAIVRHAAELQGVSRERIGDELRRMLGHPSRAVAVARLHELALDGPMLEEGAMGVPALGFRTLASEAAGESIGAGLAAWCLDRGVRPEQAAAGLRGGAWQAMLERWRRGLCLSNEEAAGFAEILGVVRALRVDWSGLGMAGQKRLTQAPGFGAGAAFVAVWDGQLGGMIAGRVRELERTASGLAPKALISGEDLIGAGLRPGPGFKRILDGVYDAQLEDRISSRDEAIALAATLAAGQAR